MEQIRLPNGLWYYDPSHPLGQAGGFGQVFLGTSETGDEVAVKRLHIGAADSAHRELRVSDLLRVGTFAHVIAVLDAGQDSDSDRYFVVMAKAEKSLQDELAQLGHFEVLRAVGIALEILDGLDELPDLVHRDLKPPNVLLHAGVWKLADLGIARFVEESTSLNTLRDCLSPPYAAPEQWRMERTSAATDIYALGCILFALLTGDPPFHAEDTSALQSKHLYETPTIPDTIPALLRTVISFALRKRPETRPARARLRELLTSVLATAEAELPRPGLRRLGEAAAVEAARQARQEADSAEATRRLRQRVETANAGRDVIESVIERLFDAILREAPSATISDDVRGRICEHLRQHNTVALGLGEASLRFVLAPRETALDEGAFERAGLDAVTGAAVSVRQASPPYHWSASLWYRHRLPDEEYRWWEVAYHHSGPPDSSTPMFLERVADAAAAEVGSTFYSVAWGPHCIDDENEDDFVDRWCAVLSAAYHGRLSHPPNLPLPPDFWKTWT